MYQTCLFVFGLIHKASHAFGAVSVSRSSCRCWQQRWAVGTHCTVLVSPCLASCSHCCTSSLTGFSVFSSFTLLSFLLSLGFPSQFMLAFKYLNWKSVFTEPVLNLVLSVRAWLVSLGQEVFMIFTRNAFRTFLHCIKSFPRLPRVPITFVNDSTNVTMLMISFQLKL